MKKMIGCIAVCWAMGAMGASAQEMRAADVAEMLCPVGKTGPAKVVDLAKGLREVDKGVDAADKNGRTLLMTAAELDNRLAVAYLVALGADVTKTDKNKMSVEKYACSPTVKTLLSVCRTGNETISYENKKKRALEQGLDDPAVRMERIKLLVKDNKLREMMDVLQLGGRLDDGATPALHISSANMTPEALALLVRRGYDVNTPLEGKVALPGGVNATKLALALGLKPSDAPQDRFVIALLTDDEETVKDLLSQDAKWAAQDIPLYGAPVQLAQSGEMVRLLHGAGAEGKTAPAPEAVRAILRGQTAGAREADVVQACIECGWDAKADKEALMILCRDGSADGRTVKALLEAGAPLCGEELHYAAARGKVAAVKELLAHKADPNALNAEGDTPLLFLVRSYKTLGSSLGSAVDTIKALVRGGADTKAKTKDGQNVQKLSKSLGLELHKLVKSLEKKAK